MAHHGTSSFFLVLFLIHSFFKKIILCIFDCAGSSRSTGFSLVGVSGSHSLVALRGVPIAVASLVEEHRTWGTQASAVAARGLLNSCGSWAPEHSFNSCSTWAELLLDTWDLPGSGIEPVSSVLAGGFFTIELPGKPSYSFFMQFHNRRAERCILVHGVNWRGGRFSFVSILPADGLSLLILGNVKM